MKLSLALIAALASFAVALPHSSNSEANNGGGNAARSPAKQGSKNKGQNPPGLDGKPQDGPGPVGEINPDTGIISFNAGA